MRFVTTIVRQNGAPTMRATEPGANAGEPGHDRAAELRYDDRGRPIPRSLYLAALLPKIKPRHRGPVEEKRRRHEGDLCVCGEPRGRHKRRSGSRPGPCAREGCDCRRFRRRRRG